MAKREKKAGEGAAVRDEGLAEILRESKAQRAALQEFEDQWAQLARLHILLLRDANEASARHRRTAEILEFYREDMALRWENEIAAVKCEHGERRTPGGRMRFNVGQGWHRAEGA